MEEFFIDKIGARDSDDEDVDLNKIWNDDDDDVDDDEIEADDNVNSNSCKYLDFEVRVCFGTKNALIVDIL